MVLQVIIAVVGIIIAVKKWRELSKNPTGAAA